MVLDNILTQLGLNQFECTAFKTLLAETNCNINQLNTCPISCLTELKNITQKRWLRKQDIWQTTDTQRLKDWYTNAQDHFKTLGVLDEIKPTQTYYDCVLILGAHQGDTEVRLNYMAQLWQEGIRFNKIYLLGGQRPLIINREPIANILKTEMLPLTEMNMMHTLYNKLRIEWPKALADLNTIPVDPPMQKTSDGRLRRPNTSDTLNEWLSLNPECQNILAISNQPYARFYQAALVNSLLIGRHTETIGASASSNPRVSVILDSLARFIFVRYPELYTSLSSEQNKDTA